ncbi:hypothetical protein NCCP2165_10660 [Halomonas sp. NCCP-2165]|nr:hypothetical protein NCCP2165_10660 [Halomonas sp. NCCP-2165]
MVERFNGRLSDVSETQRYTSGEDLEQTLKCYAWLYSHHIPQKALHHQPPIAAMKECQARRPELFTKRVVNHAGPDTHGVPRDHIRVRTDHSSGKKVSSRALER